MNNLDPRISLSIKKVTIFHKKKEQLMNGFIVGAGTTTGVYFRESLLTPHLEWFPNSLITVITRQFND